MGGSFFNPVDTVTSTSAYRTAQESKKTNKLLEKALRAQQRNSRLQHVGMVAEGPWVSARWDGEWLDIEVSEAAPRLFKAALKGSGSRVHVDEIAAVTNRTPSLFRGGSFDILTHDEVTRSLPYDQKSEHDFSDLTYQVQRALSDRVRGADSAALPPPPLAPAGWFSAPDHEGWLRYWDGSAWTDHYHDPNQV